MIKDRLRMVAKGLANPRKAADYATQKVKLGCCNASVFLNSRRPIGTPIFSKEWDMLVVLDTCRPDMLRAIRSEYDFLTDINKIWSTGAMSAEWIATTFDRKWADEIANCGYITANPHSGTVLENRLEDRFRGKGHHTARLRKYGNYDFVHTHELEYYAPVWKQSDSTDKGHNLYGDPRKVTEYAVSVDREQKIDKLILHYMPPHFPYVGDSIREGRGQLFDHESEPFDYIKYGGDPRKVIQAYKSTLRWILDEVQILLNNTDREKVVITADHGEAFGELGTYKHPSGSLNPRVRYVPWVETTATDNKTMSPNLDEEAEESTSVEQRLEALGYV